MAGISARSPNVNDLEAIDRAIEAAIAETERPSLVVVHSHIGYGSPVQDTAKAHGSPLGKDGVAKAREALGWQHPPFSVPDEVYADWRSQVGERAAAHAAWKEKLERYRGDEPERAAEFERVMAGRLPDGLARRPADVPARHAGGDPGLRRPGLERLRRSAFRSWSAAPPTSARRPIP